MIVLAILVIIAFAWLYNPADLRELGANVAARVYGKVVTQADIDRQVRSYQLAIALGQLDLVGGLGGMSGNESADVSEYVWNIFILRHQAAILGIDPTVEQIADRIRTLPAFQTNAQFDPRKFEAFTQTQLGPRGMTTLQLEDVMRDALRFETLKAIVASPAALGAQEAARAKRFFQKSDLLILPFEIEPIMASITVTEDDARSYYEKNRAQFLAPETISLEVAKFSLPEAKKDVQGKDRVAAMQDLALAATALTEPGITDFAGAAKSAGADVSTSNPFDRRSASFASGLPPAVAQGAFLLTEGRTISDVTQAGDEFFVYRIASRQPERELTFEEARPTAEIRIKANEAAKILQERGTAAIAKIREAVTAGTPIKDAAIAAGVTPQAFEGVDPASPQLPPQFMSALRAAMLLEPGQISNFFQTQTGGAAVAVLTRATEAAGQGVEDIENQLLENKQDLFFAVWMDSQRQSAIEFPRRQAQ